MVDGKAVEQPLHGLSAQAENLCGADASALDGVVHQRGEGELVISLAGLSEFIEGVEDDEGIRGSSKLILRKY